MIEVIIEKMALGGYGIARHQGLVLFIPFSAPGDQLKVQITEKKKNFAYAEIIEIIKPSSDRIQASCPVYGTCGGCNFQHLRYESQLQQKQMIILEHLQKYFAPTTQFLPIVASPQSVQYRNRIQVHLQGNQWGYYARKSHELVAVSECLIAEPSLVKEANQAAQNRKKDAKPERLQLYLQSDLQVKSDKNETEDDLMGFAQVNRFQNEILIRTLTEWSQDGNPIWPEIWDLYSGAGNFTFPLFSTHRKSKMTAVELSSASVRSAQKLMRDNNFSPQKIKFLLSDVEVYLRRAVIEQYGLIILDPPRTGCGLRVMESLSSQKFNKILYVSCNPSTLARDLGDLKINKGAPFKISRVQGFDMFPQTDHIEVLVEIVSDQRVDDLP